MDRKKDVKEIGGRIRSISFNVNSKKVRVEIELSKLLGFEDDEKNLKIETIKPEKGLAYTIRFHTDENLNIFAILEGEYVSSIVSLLKLDIGNYLEIKIFEDDNFEVIKK